MIEMLIGMALAASPTMAQVQPWDPSEAHDGDFGAKLVVTDDPASFWAQWVKPDTPRVSTTNRIARGQTVETVIVFHDCKPAADGNCNVTVHYEMTAPNGLPYQKPLDAVAWRHPPAPDHNLQPSEASLGFKLDPPDQLGVYHIVAKLTDEVAGRTLTLRETLTAVEKAPPPQPAS